MKAKEKRRELPDGSNRQRGRRSKERPRSRKAESFQHVQAGEKARKNRKPDEALHQFERALVLLPEDPVALSGLGFTHLDLRNYDTGLPYFERALSADPQHGRSLYGAAIATLNLQRYDEALSYAARLEGLGQPEGRAHASYMRGVVYYEQGEFAEAVPHLHEALQGPGTKRNRELRYLLAQCFVELNRPAEAVPLLRKLQKPRGDRKNWSHAIADQLGWILLKNEKLQDSEAEFQQILDKYPKDRRAMNGLGRVFLARHDYRKAKEQFKRVLGLDHINLDALDGMAEAHKQMGELTAAAGYIEQIKGLYKIPEAQIKRRLRTLDRERQRRDAELLRVRNIAALNVMATGIAHEFRQPLSVIRLAAQSARRSLVRGEYGNLDEALADIDSNVVRLDRIIAVLRDIGGAKASAPSRVSLVKVIEQALVLFYAQLRNRGIALNVEDVDFDVIADAISLEQVIINLIANARDAMDDAKDKNLRMWAVSGTDTVWLYIKDTGRGMTTETRHQALDPFFTTKTDKGTGLGLYIAYNLMRKMKGQLAIKDTRTGRGTTIELILPKAPEKEDE